MKKGGITGEIKRVEGRTEFVNALIEFEPDLILSDHSLPSFDSQEALSIVNQTSLHVPFILVTATVSEEYAVSIMKQGASDYILKDRMQRLPNAVRTVIEKFETEAELAHQLLLQQKLVAETNIKAQEKVRSEIGRELHDNINQILAAAKLYTDSALKYEMPTSELLLKSQLNLAHAIEEIRRLSHTLVTPSLGDVELIQIINDMLEDVRLTTALKVKLTVRNYKESSFNNDTKLTIYRIIQEQITNILKHSGASNAYVQLSVLPHFIRLVISDNGNGIDTNKKTGGIGLQNMKNRVEYFDGTLKISSKSGEGYTLEVNIPIKVGESQKRFN